MVKPKSCSHGNLLLECSRFASHCGYTQPSAERRATAATSTGRVKETERANRGVEEAVFPAPLILPGDDLAHDPTYSPQSLLSWIREKDRNPITNERNVIYIASPPSIASDVEFMRQWTRLPASTETQERINPPNVKDVANYLRAFYHGLLVKLLPTSSLQFAAWEDEGKGRTRSTMPEFVGFRTTDECVRVRVRPAKLFPGQLNLDDLLDAAISMVPEDAYALILLMNHDLYESDEDEFVCGRAYGGSRVAVVSSARYDPTLDESEGIDRDHAWPASHCLSYVERLCRAEVSSVPASRTVSKVKKSKSQGNSSQSQADGSAITAAVAAHKALPRLTPYPSAKVLSGLWLGRVCRTASHELGHCFGMDHCVYYACSMQGTASLAEDTRQPPYLCHVDLAKILQATGMSAQARHNAILGFCDAYSDVHMFAAFAAWTRELLLAITGVIVVD